MKRTGKYLLIAILTLTFALSLAACGGGGDTALSAPTGLDVTDYTLTWTAVDGANGYSVDVSGTTKSASTNSFSLEGLTVGTQYNFRVKALGGGNKTDSEWSGMKSYMIIVTDLAVPQNIALSGTTLSWGAIEYAGGYTVDINGEEYTTATNSLDLATVNGDGISAAASYTAKVRTNAKNSFYTPSAYSNNQALTITGIKRTTPTGLALSEHTLSWSIVTGANGYTLYANTQEFDLDANTCNIGELGLTLGTEYTFKVIAKGKNAFETNSEQSAAYTQRYRITLNLTTEIDYYLSVNTNYPLTAAALQAIAEKHYSNIKATNGVEISMVEYGDNGAWTARCIINTTNDKSTFAVFTGTTATISGTTDTNIAAKINGSTGIAVEANTNAAQVNAYMQIVYILQERNDIEHELSANPFYSFPIPGTERNIENSATFSTLIFSVNQITSAVQNLNINEYDVYFISLSATNKYQAIVDEMRKYIIDTDYSNLDIDNSEIETVAYTAVTDITADALIDKNGLIS